MACHTLGTADATCRAELAWGEVLVIVSNNFYIVLGEGDCPGFAHVVEVEPGVAWLKDDGPCVVVDHKMAAVIGHGVVCDAVEGLHVLEQEYVHNSLGIILNPSIAAEVSNCVDEGFPPVGVNGNGLVDTADVGEEVAIAEDFHSGLIVNEHPEPVECVT